MYTLVHTGNAGNLVPVGRRHPTEGFPVDPHGTQRVRGIRGNLSSRLLLHYPPLFLTDKVQKAYHEVCVATSCALGKATVKPAVNPRLCGKASAGPRLKTTVDIVYKNWARIQVRFRIL